MIKTNRENILSGFIWSFGERIIAQVVSLIVGVVLARILAPEDYGVVSIVMIFISFCDIFVSFGFGTAIVRQKEADDIDFNTAFIISLSMSIVLYIIIYFSAPFISQIYDIDILKSVMRVFGVRILISSINNIQHAYIQRKMMYKKFFFATLFGTLFSCFLGVTMAYGGFGVWSLVAQYISNSIIDTVFLFFVGGWRPKFQFSLNCAKNIYSFGWKMLCSQLIYTLSNDLRGLLIGAIFGSNYLAYYDQGKKYPAVMVDNINVAITKVMLPAFAQNQDDIYELKDMLRKAIRLGSYVISPLMFGLFSISKEFVYTILTDKWLPVIPFIQIMCLAYMFRPLEELCHRAILALGKSGTSMRIMTFVNIFSISLTIFGALYLKDILWVTVFYLFHSFLSLVCFMHASNKYIYYDLKEQISDIAPSLFISFIMALLLMIIDFDLTVHNGFLIMMIKIILGIVIYFTLSKIFKFQQYDYIVEILEKIKNKN